MAAKERHVADMAQPPPGAGTVGAYLAMCADSKLIFDYRLGDRGDVDATAFAKSLASKLRRKPNGEFAVRPTIVTDGLKSYEEAFNAAVGADADRAMMIILQHQQEWRNPTR